MKTANELIFDRFISPLQKPRANYIGIEIEMPIVHLNSEKTDKAVSIAAVQKANAPYVLLFQCCPSKCITIGVLP